jgi:hypothetical protein
MVGLIQKPELRATAQCSRCRWACDQYSRRGHTPCPRHCGKEPQIEFMVGTGPIQSNRKLDENVNLGGFLSAPQRLIRTEPLLVAFSTFRVTCLLIPCDKAALAGQSVTQGEIY